jgi:hypothetical protein
MPRGPIARHDAAMPSAAAARSTTRAAAPPVRRLMLVPSDSPRSPEGVRRFRLAMRRLEGRAGERAALRPST